MQRVVSAKPRALALDDQLGPIEGPEDLCLVIGGDGTMLEAIHRYDARYRYLGLNCGHLGFLMNEVDVDTRARIEAGAWFAQRFPRLRMRCNGTTTLAVNDVYIERSSGSTCHLKVTVDGVEVVDRMVADGVIAATPLGSTAYSFSAGGPAAHPLLQAIHLTPICPHQPRLAPIVLPAASKVRVEVLEPELRPARVVVDGEGIEGANVVEIDWAESGVDLCFFDGHDFTSTLMRKILRH